MKEAINRKRNEMTSKKGMEKMKTPAKRIFEYFFKSLSLKEACFAKKGSQALLKASLILFCFSFSIEFSEGDDEELTFTEKLKETFQQCNPTNPNFPDCFQKSDTTLSEEEVIAYQAGLKAGQNDGNGDGGGVPTDDNKSSDQCYNNKKGSVLPSLGDDAFKDDESTKKCTEEYKKEANDSCYGQGLAVTAKYLNLAGYGFALGEAIDGDKDSAAKGAEAIATGAIGSSALNATAGTACLTKVTFCKRHCKKRIEACKDFKNKLQKLGNNNSAPTAEEICKNLAKLTSQCFHAPNFKDIKNKVIQICNKKTELSSPCVSIDVNSAIEEAEGIKEECNKLVDKGVAALDQSLRDATQAAIAWAAKNALEPDEDKKNSNNETPPSAPTSLDVGEGSMGFIEQGGNSQTTSQVTGGDEDDSSGPTPPDSSKPDSDEDPTGNKKADKKDDSGSPITPPGSFAGNTDSSDTENEAGQDENSRDKNRIGRFTGGRGGFSSGYSPNLSSSRQSSSGGKHKQAHNKKKFSAENVKRKLSSLSKRHKSIFEHMSTLIKGYCNEGGKTCQ